MMKKSLMKTCMPLMLAAALLLGSASAVTAESSAGAQAVQTETVQAEDAAGAAEQAAAEEKTGGAEQTAENSGEESTENSTLTEEKAANTSSAENDAVQKEAQKAEDTEASGEEDSSSGKAEDSDQAEETADEGTENTEEDSEEQTDVPYEELLGQQNLIVVTLDVDAAASGEITVETVENLSDSEVEALQVYIEENGYTVTTEEIVEEAPEAQVRTVTINNNGFISLAAEGYGTGYDAMFYVAASDYQGNGNAYCLDPSKQAPGSSSQGTSISYTTTVTGYSDAMLLKIMYYGFGGAGDITGDYASTPTARHILTHMAATKRAAELGIPGAGDYTYGANSTAVAKADALYAAIQAEEDIRGTVSILTPVEGQQTIMLLASYSLIPKTIKIKVSKTSGDSGISGDNSCYSLEGAVYGVYSDEALEHQLGTLTTGADGVSDVLTVDQGAYYVKELTAPKGFLLDETIYKVTGKTGEILTVHSKDQPAADDLELLLQKIDSVTGEANALLQGAEFTVNYYAAEEAASGKADRTWVFATGKQGEIHLEESYLKEGDSLYTDAAGNPVLPLGVITIQETKAPEDYQLNDTVYTCTISQNQKGAAETSNLPVGENAVKESPVTTELSVKKTVSGSGGNKNTEFRFTLQLQSLTGRDLPESIDCVMTQNGEEEQLTVQGAAGEDGKTYVYSFTLEHGQEITFRNLPIQTSYLVTELDGESQGYLVESENEEGTLKEEAVSVSFTNSKEMIVPTGASLNLHGITGILIFSMLSAAALFCLNRNKIRK